MANGQEQQQRPPDPDEVIEKQLAFDGEWIPDHDPSKIGEKNFAELKNFRYIEQGIGPIEGYTALTTNIMHTTYKYPGAGIQLRGPHTTRSFVVVHGWNADESDARILYNDTAIPDAGDFSSTTLFSPNAAAVQPRFSQLPRGIGYSNEYESCIWEGDESLAGIVMLIDSISGLTVTNPRDYSIEMGNDYSTSNNDCALTGSALTLLVGSTRPLKGIKLYIKTASGATSTTDVKEWTGGAWTSCTNQTDNTTSGGESMTTTGWITFDTTIGSSDPAFIENTFLYYYQVTITGGTPVVYKVTVDMPFQLLKDVWDGVYRTCIAFQANVEASGFQDYTLEVNTESNVDYPICARLGHFFNDASDTIEIMSEERATAIRFEILGSHMHNISAATMTIKYWDGDSWASVGTLYDGTLDASGGTKTLNQSGVVSWRPPAWGSERARTRWGVTGFVYQITTSAALHSYSLTTATVSFVDATDSIVDATTGNFLSGGLKVGDSIEIAGDSDQNGVYLIATVTEHIITVTGDIGDEAAGDDVVITRVNPDSILVDLCTLVPAPKIMRGHKYPQRYQQRAFWGGDVYGKEENALDYSMANTIDVYNGIDSSDRGQRIYVGGPEKLTGGTVVFNRFGSGIFETMLIFKEAETHLLFGTNPDDFKLYQISQNYGCPAPLTIASAEVGFELAQGTFRNIAVWLSYRGPVLFDGAIIAPITGIDLYFDTRKTTVVNMDYIKDSVGWFDPYWMEYNLLIPSGSGQTTLNVHLVYDLLRKRWYKVNYDGGDSDMPQFGFIVKDESGAVYPYLLRDDGHMLRGGYGSDWNGNDMIHSVTTADMVPSGSIWHHTMMQEVKLAHEVPDFDLTSDDITIETVYYVDGKEDITELDDFVMQLSDFTTEDIELLEEDYDIIYEEDGVTPILYDEVDKPRYYRISQGLQKAGLTHQFKFSRTSTSTSFAGNFGKRFLWWGYRAKVTGTDRRIT